jgi:hypothetical protein
MCLLFELGILLAPLVAKPLAEGESDYRPPTDEEMERELDKSETK